MMTTIGVRELKEQTSKILRRVREGGETIEITYRGQPVARLVPIRPSPPSDEELAAYWTDLDQLTAEVSAKWPEEISAVDAVRDVRRDL